MRIPEKEKSIIQLPTQAKYPELFKTLTKDKHLKPQSIKLNKAEEIYMKNVRTANLEKAKKAAGAKDEAKIFSGDIPKIDFQGASLS